MLYNVVLVSAVKLHRSAVCVCVPPSPFLPSRFCPGAALPMLYSSFPLASYFTHGGVSVIATLSILSHPLLPLQIFSKTVSVTLTTLQNSCSHICFCCLVADLVTPISFSVAPFSSCPQSFPGSGSFPVSQLFVLGGQNSGASASASVFLLYIQG